MIFYLNILKNIVLGAPLILLAFFDLPHLLNLAIHFCEDHIILNF
jgi:hypothetical protein